MTIEIIYEDNDIVLINKPAGVVCNDSATISEETIQSWFFETYLKGKESSKENYTELIPSDFDDTFGSVEEIFEQRKGLVHRLDRETSGILILAKNPGSLVHLLRQFKKRETQKKYLCLAHGKFGVAEDTISFPLGRSTRNRMKYRVDIDGRNATTFYTVLKYYSAIKYDQLLEQGIAESAYKTLKKNKKTYQGFSLVECWPKTGRTHQIRVHMAHIKHPLVGDKHYLGKKRSKLDPLWCERHFLHASQISFMHPRKNKQVTFKAELPDDLQQVLENLHED